MAKNLKSTQDKLIFESTKVLEVSEKAESQKQYLSLKIYEILKEMEKFASGDLTSKLPFETNDEIGKLFKGFNISVSNLEELITEIINANTTVSSSTNNISTSLEEISVGSREQSSQTLEIYGAVEQMNKTIFETVRDTASTSKSAKKAGQHAENVGLVVLNSIEGMNNIANVVYSAAQKEMELEPTMNRLVKLSK